MLVILGLEETPLASSIRQRPARGVLPFKSVFSELATSSEAVHCAGVFCCVRFFSAVEKSKSSTSSYSASAAFLAPLEPNPPLRAPFAGVVEPSVRQLRPLFAPVSLPWSAFPKHFGVPTSADGRQASCGAVQEPEPVSWGP
eukprot:scaffold1239_cov175-Pinguiococcus_pyrenoidosus.AAC.14